MIECNVLVILNEFSYKSNNFFEWKFFMKDMKIIFNKKDEYFENIMKM